MNAAILLVTSAWMTGQAPEVILPVQHHAPAASACGASCGGSCCDDSGGVGHRLRGRLHGLFHRNNGCDDGCQPQPVDCCESRGHRLFGHRRNSCDSCQETCHAPRQDCCNDSCGCGGPSLLDRIRGMFHRDRGCCADTCNNGCATGGTVVVPGPAGAPAGEPLKEQPKKMPSKAAPKQARVITPAVETPIAPALQDAPAINAAPAAPAIAPRIIETERNPF